MRTPVSSTIAATRSRLSALPKLYRQDLGAAFLLVVLTLAVQWNSIYNGTMLGVDAATIFNPPFSLLGEALRSGRIPGWNPYIYAGIPFAADPQSGWTYLPAMLLYGLLPLASAAKSFIVGHLLLAGLATYGLARVLNMRVAGALTAAVAYELTGFLFDRSVCCWALMMVSTWVPVILLCTELSLRSSNRLHRVLWWGVAGFGLSQVLASWLGQGTYYTLFVLGGYIAYRAWFTQRSNLSGMRSRLAAPGLHGGTILLFAVLFGAAGLLPRLEYNALSNLAGGYPEHEVARLSGWSVLGWKRLLQSGSLGYFYAGSVTVLLAIIAPVAARTRHAVPFWAGVTLAALILTGHGPTPLHSLLSVLPGFANIHSHYPERVMIVGYLSIAMLAGATVNCLWQRSSRATLVGLGSVGAALCLTALDLLLHELAFPRSTLIVLGLATILVGAATMLRRYEGFFSTALVVLLFVDLVVTGRAVVEDGIGRFKKVNLEAYYAPIGATRFLVSQGRPERFRYFGYDPWIRRGGVAYRFAWFGPRDHARAVAIGVNNRASMAGLHDIQGYNAVHIARYDDLMTALNNRQQEYHELNVLDTGIISPLLDLLNVRYVIIPAGRPAVRGDLRQLRRTYPPVWSDSSSLVLERPTALPRAWLVHSARQVRTGEALQLLVSGAVDPRHVVLLEGSPPPLGAPTADVLDEAEITRYAQDGLTIRTRSSAPGMLVLSEPYYPAWRAYVDGKPAPLYAANHAFRAVPVGAGEHTVVLRYESLTIKVGVLVSAAAYLCFLALCVVVGWRERPLR